MIKLNKQEFLQRSIILNIIIIIITIIMIHLNNNRIHVIECPFNIFTPQPSYGRIICWLLYLCYNSNENSLADLLHGTMYFFGFYKKELECFGHCRVY